MIIQSVNPSNPVLVFLHGGPGMPEFFLQTTHPTGLEQDFTVVWWDQRGADMSWTSDLHPQELTIERLLLDTIDVADYLRDRFGQERILLLGHSWGSFLGIQVVARAPDRFYTYVGMAQVAYQLRSEVMARDEMLAAYRAQGHTRIVRKIEAALVTMHDGMSKAYLSLRDAATHRLGGGTTRGITSDITGVFLPVLDLPIYTISENINLWRGKAWSRAIMWDEILHTDLRDRINRLDIQVHFFIGVHDQTAMPALSRPLFDRIDAPRKAVPRLREFRAPPRFSKSLTAPTILRGIGAVVEDKRAP